ncbi:MAG TPA: DUF2142 domain-containing protein [Candidatus Dormibacteraeota bacterium]|nr:DUF2142 domain-containing protein [Candidatus Dormibacteraeota bacterium]
MRWLLVAGYASLAIAWVFTNPAGAAPDEPANYVKALGIRDGQLAASPGQLPVSVAARYGVDGPRYAFANSTTRWVHAPSELLSSRFACNAFRPTVPAGCLSGQSATMLADQPTYTGAYEPFVYVLPSLLSWPAHDPMAGLLLIRLGFAVISVALIGLAITLLWSASAPSASMIGILLGVTPMVISTSATVSASAPEICAGLAFAAAIIRISRPGPVWSVAWIGFGVSGVVLALSRPLGVGWVALGVLVLLLMASPRRVLREADRTMWISCTAVGVAMAIALSWTLIALPHGGASVRQFMLQLPGTILALPDTLSQAIGVFGWLDTWLPPGAYVMWELALVALIATAFMVGNNHQRMCLLLLMSAGGAACLLVGAGILMPAGFGLQGRYVLPFLVIIPLFAGEVVAQGPVRLGLIRRESLVAATAMIAAAVQGISWYVNSQRNATGLPAPLLFFERSDWSPILGWLPWLCLVVLGCLCLVLGARGRSHARQVWMPRREPSGTRARRVVVLPAYRAEKTLREVVGKIPKGEVDRILLVDDASSDQTAEVALQLGIDVIKHPRNLGYGGNQKTCYTNALLMGAEVVVMLHPDGQYDPGLVPALCRAVEEGKGDVVLGSRWLGLDPAAAGMPSWKRLGNRFLTWTENRLLGLKLSEYHTGYRAYSRRFLETIPFAENSNDFVFDTQVLVQAASFGFRVAEIPAIGRYFEEASSIGFRTSAVYGLKTLGALAAYLGSEVGIPSRWLKARRTSTVAEISPEEAAA